MLQGLFDVAKELDSAAYSAKFVPPSALSAGAKGIIGVAVDFWGFDRKKILQVDGVPATPDGSTVATADTKLADTQSPAPLQEQLPGLASKGDKA